MHALEFEHDGKKKQIERRMVIRCIMCSAEPLVCPDDQDPWGWLRADPGVQAYLELHRAHGTKSTVGPQIVATEKD